MFNLGCPSMTTENSVVGPDWNAMPQSTTSLRQVVAQCNV